MSLTIVCPNCNVVLQGRMEYIGRKVTCKKCKQAFIVPEPQVERIAKTANSRRIWMIAGSLGSVVLLGAVGISAWALMRPRNRSEEPVANQSSDLIANESIAEKSEDASRILHPSNKDQLNQSNQGSSHASVHVLKQLSLDAAAPETKVLVQFSTDDQGQRQLYYHVGERKANNEGAETQTLLLDNDSGIALHTTVDSEKLNWKWNLQTTESELAVAKYEGDGFRITKLNDFGTPGNATGYLIDHFVSSPWHHKHLWSADGKLLYVLTRNKEPMSNGPRRLLVVDAENWKTKACVRLDTHLTYMDDICWSSQGLMMLVTPYGESNDIIMRSDSGKQAWTPVSAPTELATRLVTIDPKSMTPTKVNFIAHAVEIAGTAKHDTVYVVSHGDAVSTIDVKRDLLMNVQIDLSGLYHPMVSPDGKWLLSTRNDNFKILNRFRADSHGVEADFQRNFDAQQFSFCMSPKGESVSFVDQGNYVAVAVDDFQKIISKVPSMVPKGLQLKGRFVFDHDRKIGFKCEQPSAGESFELEIQQENRTMSVKLEDPPLGKLMERSNFPDGTSIPMELFGQTPFAMSVAPNGRGAIAFTLDAAYWIEVDQPGNSPTKVIAPSGIANTIAFSEQAKMELARRTLPTALAKIEFHRSNSPINGQAFEFPKTSSIESLNANPHTGDLAIVLKSYLNNSSQNSLVVLKNSQLSGTEPSLSTSAIPFEPRKLVSTCFKRYKQRDYIVVLRDMVLWVLDPETLQLADPSSGLKTFFDFKGAPFEKWPEIRSNSKQSLFSSDADDSNVVVALGSDDPIRYGLRYFNLDLIQGDLAGPETQIKPGYRNESGVMFQRQKLADSREFRQVEQDSIFTSGTSENGTPIFVDSQIRGQPTLLVMHNRPYIISHSPNHLSFHHRYVPHEAMDVEIPSDFRSNYELHVFDDFQRDRVFVSGRFEPKDNHPMVSWLWLLSNKQAKLPNRPILAAGFRIPSQMEPNKIHSIPFEIADRRSKLTLVSAPEGVEVKGSKLTWKPTWEDTGRHPIVVKIEYGETSVQKLIYVSVGFPRIELPFKALDFQPTPNGNTVLAWSKESLALIDIPSRKVRVLRHTKSNIQSAILAGEHLYVLYSGDNVLEKCSSKDLEVESSYSLSDQIQELQVVRDKYLFLISASESRSNEKSCLSYVLELPSLKSTKLTQIMEHTILRSEVVAGPNGEWVLGNLVMDAKLQAVINLFSLEWTSLMRLPSAQLPGIVLANPPTKNWASKSQSLQLGELKIQPLLVSKIDPILNTQFSNLSLEMSDGESQKRILKIGEYDRLNGNSKIRAVEDRIFVLISNGLLYPSLTDLGLSKDVWETKPKIRISSKEKVKILLPQGETEIKFFITGGKPPYEIQCTLPNSLFAPSTTQGVSQKDIVKIDSKKTSVSIDGAKLQKRFEESRPYEDILRAIDKVSGSQVTLEESVERYRSKVEDELNTVVKQPFKGFPVSIPLTLTAKDSDGSIVSLTYETLLQLPTNSLLKKLDETVGQQVGRKRNAPRTLLPILWNPTPITLSDEIRSRYSIEVRKDFESSIKKVTLSTINIHCNFLDPNYQRHGVQGGPWMDWKLSTGKKRMGQVVGVSSSGVIMVWKAMDDAREISVSFSEFADESLLLMPKAINHFPRKVSRSSNDKNALQVALDKFRNEYGCMPHYAIVDQAGTPLLSWRVALLPYMGYSELFGMFRLDEPWDSPHNQKLLPMMPVYYNLTQPGLELGQATIKAITGPGTAFPIDAICSLKDLDKPALDVLLFVETKGDHSIPWTKPEDIVVSTDPTWQEHLHSAKLDNQQWNLKWYGDGKLKFEPFPVGRKPME